MKIKICILISLMIGCSTKHVSNYKMDEYQYPIDSLVSPKVFVYQRTDSAEKLTCMYQRLIQKDSQTLLITTQLGTSMIRDSTVYLVEKNHVSFLENYMIMQNTKTQEVRASKGEIIENEDDGVTIERKIRYENPFVKNMMNTIEVKFRYDTITVCKVFNQDMPCIKFTTVMNFAFRYKYIPLLGKDLCEEYRLSFLFNYR